MEKWRVVSGEWRVASGLWRDGLHSIRTKIRTADTGITIKQSITYFQAARRLAGEAKKVFVPTVVQVEMVWVLESGYGLSKEAVVEALEHPELRAVRFAPLAAPYGFVERRCSVCF